MSSRHKQAQDWKGLIVHFKGASCSSKNVFKITYLFIIFLFTT
uniref:Uncharacterized protein n=1 Tax=Anguilla anguilla TaxID=7936 RepID=A0A0E9VVM5_ANGAN